MTLPGLFAQDTALTTDLRARVQSGWRDTLAAELYGPIPAPPNHLEVTRHPLPDAHAERLHLTLSYQGRQFGVDAALWLPPDQTGPVPIICGLDFVGPAGVLTSDAFPLDPDAVIYTAPEFGAEGAMTAALRGTSATRWPIKMLLDAGFAVLVSCYGSWTPDCPTTWRAHGVAPLMDAAAKSRAISLWAWALARLIDAAATLPEVDTTRSVVAGHSRLGKAALWAAANDNRIVAVFANQSGCGGASPARHDTGETLAQMSAAFPHWTLDTHARTPPADLPFDQHHLLACIAPKAIFLASAKDDLWADPVGSYKALRAAAPAWTDNTGTWPHAADIWTTDAPIIRGNLGYSIRDGGHALTPQDWRNALAFLAAQVDLLP